MERMSILCDGNQIALGDLPEKILKETGIEPPPRPLAATDGAFRWPDLGDLRDYGPTLKDFLDQVEDRLLTQALEEAEGVKNRAAEILGIKRTTLIEKLKKKDMM